MVESDRLFEDEDKLLLVEPSPAVPLLNRSDTEKRPIWKIAVVDDEESVHQVTTMALRRLVFMGRCVEFVHAYSTLEAQQLLADHPDTALVLLDVVMEHDQSGLELVRYFRETLRNRWIQIILRTGQPGQTPVRDVIVQYEINDYREKQNLTADALYTAVIAALRTYHLQQQIYLCSEQAQKANEAKTLFLANMSHEMRTPLHAILSFGRIGQSRVEAVPLMKLKEYFSHIVESGERLLRLLNNLLDMAKLESGKIELKLSEYDMCRLIEEAIAECSALTLLKGVALHYHRSPEPIRVWIEREKMIQIFCNLLNNAIKFTPSGGNITIRLGVERHSGLNGLEKSMVVVTVEDEGIGIPVGEENRIFEKFTQSSRTDAGTGGTGLGLAISREVAMLHGGQIVASNAAHGGAIFTFTLPYSADSGYQSV